jgi:hypothetical protein
LPTNTYLYELMTDLFHKGHQFPSVTNFQDLVSTPFYGAMNALCWRRELPGDFSEIVKKIDLKSNLTTIEADELRELSLSWQGQVAREILLNDLALLTTHGASPVLNLISCYDRDEHNPVFPTDVYSFHADRSPLPGYTFLCTYHGASSQILPNAQGIQKILVPEIRHKLKKLHGGNEAGFEEFLSEHFYDLHYQALPGADILSMGQSHLWRLAVDHPESKVLPCIHRAPLEQPGETRLMLIC